MDYEKRLQIETQIFCAFLVEDRIAWNKDPECFGCNQQELVDSAIQAADLLIVRSKQAELKRQSNS